MKGDKIKAEVSRLMQKPEESLSLADNISYQSSKLKDIIENSIPVKSSVSVKDDYGNIITSTGTNDKIKEFTTYNYNNDTLNYMLWTSLYSSSWVFRRAIDKPAQDEIRCGITLQGDEDKSKVYEELKTHNFELIQLLQWGALYGGSIAMIMFDNLEDDEYSKPMNLEKLKKSSVIRLYVTDRWYGCAQAGIETVTDMTSIDFGKPSYYNVVFANGKTLRVHHNYILRYEHRDAPKVVKNGQLQGWGYAEGSHILNELMRDDQLKSAVTSLINKSLIEVVKMDGMRGVFMGASSEEEEQLQKRLEMVTWARNFNSLTLLDKDDEYEMNNFSGLSGLSDLLQQNMRLVSAALEMQGVLYGDLKQGFSDDRNALERYDETINGRCENYVRPVLTKFLSILYKKYDIHDKLQFSFNSLLAKEQNKEKMEGLKDFIDVCSKLLEDGVFNAKLYAKSVQNYISKGIVDFGLTDEEINKLEDDFINQSEEIDLNER